MNARRDNELIRTARAILRLQRQIAKYRRQIKKAQTDLKHERKILRALAHAAENGTQSVPSRLTAGATGYRAPDAGRTPDPTETEDITTGFEDKK